MTIKDEFEKLCALSEEYPDTHGYCSLEVKVYRERTGKPPRVSWRAYVHGADYTDACATPDDAIETLRRMLNGESKKDLEALGEAPQ